MKTSELLLVVLIVATCQTVFNLDTTYGFYFTGALAIGYIQLAIYNKSTLPALFACAFIALVNQLHVPDLFHAVWTGSMSGQQAAHELFSIYPDIYLVWPFQSWVCHNAPNLKPLVSLLEQVSFWLSYIA